MFLISVGRSRKGKYWPRGILYDRGCLLMSCIESKAEILIGSICRGTHPGLISSSCSLSSPSPSLSLCLSRSHSFSRCSAATLIFSSSMAVSIRLSWPEVNCLGVLGCCMLALMSTFPEEAPGIQMNENQDGKIEDIVCERK